MSPVPSLRDVVARVRSSVPGGRLAADVLEATVLLREVERARWREGPSALVSRLRQRGLRAAPRSPAGRQRLAQLLYHLDRLLHRRPNCYRRSLVRLALDRDAAREPFVLGLDLHATGATGHAWVEGTGEASNAYDVEFRV